MFRSKSVAFFSLFLCTIAALFVFYIPISTTANAMSDEWYPPTCECSFGESAATLTSKSTEIRYDNGKASLKTSYTFFASTSTKLTCTLPVFSRQFELSMYEATLKLNDSTATPSLGYGSKSAQFYGSESYEEVLSLREALSELDTTIKVHQFIVSSTEDASFSFSIQKTDHIMYKFGWHSYSVEPSLFKVNITPNQPGSFLVFGNKPALETTEFCKVEYKEMTLNEYITEMVGFLTEMTNGYDCTDIVTHRLNEFLSSNNRISDDIFLDSVFLFTYGFLDYTLQLPVGESTIVVEQPMAVGLNSLYSPRVYVGKIYAPAQTAPYSLSVNTEQYVVDSTLQLKNNAYSGNAAESITIAFCEVQKPNLVNGVVSTKWEPWRIAVVSIGCVIGLASIISFVILIVKYKQS